MFKERKAKLDARLSAIIAKSKSKTGANEEVAYESRPDGGFSVFYNLPKNVETSKTDKLKELIQKISNSIGDYDTADDEVISSDAYEVDDGDEYNYEEDSEYFEDFSDDYDYEDDVIGTRKH